MMTRMVGDNFRRLFTAISCSSNSGIGWWISVTESRLGTSKDWHFRSPETQGKSTISTRNYSLNQEGWKFWYGFTYLNSSQITMLINLLSNCYRPDEHRYLNFHDILVKFFIHWPYIHHWHTSEHRNKAGRTESYSSVKHLSRIYHIEFIVQSDVGYGRNTGRVQKRAKLRHNSLESEMSLRTDFY